MHLQAIELINNTIMLLYHLELFIFYFFMSKSSKMSKVKIEKSVKINYSDGHGLPHSIISLGSRRYPVQRKSFGYSELASSKSR